MAGETHEQRIARLTELARKVWPGRDVMVSQGFGDEDELVGASVTVDPLGEWEQVLACGHPLALDALEAALCVLASEPPQWAVELSERLRAEALRMEGSGQADGLLFAAGAIMGAAAKGGAR